MTVPAERSWGSGLGALGVVLLVVGARLRPLRNGDLLWQIATGDEIAAQRRRLTVDVFSQPLRGQPLHDHEPLWEVLVSFLHKRGGFPALWWFALVFAVGAALFAWGVAARVKTSTSARVIAFALVLLAVSPRLDLRAEWIAFAALATAHALRGKGERPIHLLAPALVAAIAAPFHGLALLCAIVPLVHGRRRVDLAASLLCVLLVALVSPAAISSVLAHLRAPTFGEHIIEYYSVLGFVRASGDFTPIFALTLAAVAVAGLVSSERKPDALLVLVLLLPALFRVRFVAFCLLGALPCIVAGVSAVLDRALAKLRLAPALALLTCAGALTIFTTELGLHRVIAFDWSDQPVAALARVPRDARLYHPFNFGSYVIYSGRPSLIDPRAATLYPDAYARAYYDALTDERKFYAYLVAGGYDTVLLSRKHKGTARVRAALYRDARFEISYEDSFVVVFVPHAPR